MSELRILIADDHQLIRRGLRDLLATQNEWEVVGEACNGIEAVEMALRLRPDITVLDFFMPMLNGAQAAAQIVEQLPGVGVVFLTMDDSEEVIREVLEAGARVLVLKSDADRDLLDAIRAAAAQRNFFTSSLAKSMLERVPTGQTQPSKAGLLTERERQVMQLLAKGMTSREAASRLQISPRTVESHRINISRKLSFGSIADLVRYAIRNGIVTHA